MAYRLWWFLLLSIAITLWFLRGDLTHFTYWGWLSFILFCFLKFFSPRATRGRGIFFASVATIIVFGVLAMATLNEAGSLLETTVEENGLIFYFLGTYGIHYLPLAVILSTIEDVRFSLRTAALLTGGVGLFGLYLLHQNPKEIYGVDIEVSVSAGASTLLIFLAIAWLWSDKL
ncbi:MAG: hypothetical protein ACPGR8_15745 [Limisphaerales bacterium]